MAVVIHTHANPHVNAFELDERSFHVGNAFVTLGQVVDSDAKGKVKPSQMGTGNVIWDSAVALIQHMKTEHIHFKPGSSILELGAGMGLLSLLLLQERGSTVCITDGDPLVLPLLRQNIDRNLEALGENICASYTVEEYSWGDPRVDPTPFDVIIGSGIIGPERLSLDPLLQTLINLSSPTTTILFSYKIRFAWQRRFFHKAKDFFEIDECAVPREWQPSGLQIARFRKKIL